MEDLRKEYSKHALDESSIATDPIVQFQTWFEEAKNEITEANAMVLSTVGTDFRPSSRVVLLKNIIDSGFVFFTNYQSRKGRELNSNPHASLLFFWDKLERQVRIEGSVSMIDNARSEQYFYSRPVLSQIGSMISPQSQEISGRSDLQNRFEYFENHIEEIRKPAHWGGYSLVPEYFEFWQGRQGRLHDRIIYKKVDEHWKIARLAP
jgi:pyridoxamine 5'-phosphate oxidase